MESLGQCLDGQHVINAWRGLYVRDHDEPLVLDRVHSLQRRVIQQELLRLFGFPFQGEAPGAKATEQKEAA